MKDQDEVNSGAKWQATKMERWRRRTRRRRRGGVECGVVWVHVGLCGRVFLLVSGWS